MKYVLSLLLVFVLAATPNQADVTAHDMITELGTSARMIGIGNIEGFSSGADSLFENPASLYQIKDFSANFFTTTIINEIHYNLMAFGKKTEWGTFAVGYMEAKVTEIPNTQEVLVAGQTEFDIVQLYNFRKALYKASYATPLKHDVMFGSTITWYSNEFLDVSASGFNMDVGLAKWEELAEYSLVIKNIIPSQKITFTQASDDTLSTQEVLPTYFVGSGRWLVDEFDLFSQLKYMDGQFLLSLGTTFHPYETPYMSISGGYKEYLVNRVIKRNYTFGFGLNLMDVQFHYAFEKGEHKLYDNKSYLSFQMDL